MLSNSKIIVHTLLCGDIYCNVSQNSYIYNKVVSDKTVESCEPRLRAKLIQQVYI